MLVLGPRGTMRRFGGSPKMHLPKDVGTWGFIVSLIALALMYPVGLLINLTTPAVRNWISKWSRNSLAKRITLLENELTQVEKIPPIDEVQDEMLWGIKRLRLEVMNSTNVILLVITLGVSLFIDIDKHADAFHVFEAFVAGGLLVNLLSALRARRERDFRYVVLPDIGQL